jgi:hypothetical protein
MDSDTTLISVLALAAMWIRTASIAYVFPALVPPWMTFFRAVIRLMRLIAVVCLKSTYLLQLLDGDCVSH